MTPCDFRTDVLPVAKRSGCIAHGNRSPIQCANELRKELDAALLQIEGLKKDVEQWRGAAYEERKEKEEKLKVAESQFRQLQQRVSPVTEPCSCPEFCIYHARARFDDMNRLNDELVEALQHMKACGSCAEDSWNTCEGGRAALVALEKATLKRSDPAPKVEHDGKCEGCGKPSSTILCQPCFESGDYQ